MQRLIQIVLLTAALASAGCAQPEDVMWPPPQTTSQPAAYRIQPGDSLDMKFFYVPELNETYIVPPDGRITVQLAGTLQAAGSTPEELAAAASAALEGKVKHPLATVVLRSVAGNKVYVGGEVLKPGVIVLSGPTTVAQAIFEAGGARTSAELSKVLVITHAPDNRPAHRVVDVRRYLKDSRLSEDMHLARYDIVYVPRSAIADVNLFVDQYIRQLLPVTLSAGFSYFIGP